MLKIHREPFIQEIREDWILDKGLQLFIKREDVIHPQVSGNKWRKLKYNLLEARNQGKSTLLTFGGAYSNHIYATAAAAAAAGYQSIGIIRGEELADKPLNQTLRFAVETCGMRLHFVTREAYRKKNEADYINKLTEKFGSFYLIPEGGTNALAIKGAQEIVDEKTKEFDVLALSVGTGGTVSGVISAAATTQHVIGFSALKGDFLIDEVKQLLEDNCKGRFTNWEIETNYHFGGYAKHTEVLVDFIKNFEDKHHIPIEPIYTGKMLFGLFDKIKQDHFPPRTKVLAIHTGGLQGKKIRD
ncbi:pyridoxal-phosphate dependent enzyme [Fulvivirga sp. RKSG066]|uniref:1-aminocyclopropane-1-carboxylate deaminase/D-cysteine desulfhydrase n=1 Tax=Fulvivirga aurantia TaxID=2529383 RepID=UPI0012BCA021|nr:pyridoxal-phosphate dependent enzyme [Fulvivirga aurantia]MTI23141.1 pyridoxal-phosphate dependent enzyme [Fulvivirga aurantia]